MSLNRKKPMKRSTNPLKRAPLKRGDKPLKKTGRLRPVSKKRAKKMRETNPVRANYKELSACGMCLLNGGLLTQAKDVHEIVGGPVRDRTMADPSFWVPLCRRCHDKYQSLDGTRAKQFAAKVIADLYKVNQMLSEMGWELIEIEDVVKELS